MLAIGRSSFSREDEMFACEPYAASSPGTGNSILSGKGKGANASALISSLLKLIPLPKFTSFAWALKPNNSVTRIKAKKTFLFTILAPPEKFVASFHNKPQQKTERF
jgi:hypothetical protein